MKHLLGILALSTALLSSHLWAADRYISDQLFTYLHSGPSAKFRITGSINAGSRVTLLEFNKANGYSRIRDSRGRTGWVSAKFVTKQTPAITQLPLVEKALVKAKEQLANIDGQNAKVLKEKQQNISQQADKNRQLLTQQKQLIAKINALKTSNQQLQTKLDNQSQDIEMKWMINGGLVIFAGIVIGLIIPHLPRKKKTNSQWA